MSEYTDTERIEWLEANISKLRRYIEGGKVSIATHDRKDMRPGQPTVREAIDAEIRNEVTA